MAPSTSRWWASTLNQALKDRTVRMRVHPTPMTFAERRSVLQYLQQRGEIEVFRQYKDDKAHFMAVAKDAKTIAVLREEKNHVYHASVLQKMPDMTYADLTKPKNLDMTKALIHPDPLTPGSNQDGRTQKKFTIYVRQNEQQIHDHNQEKDASMHLLNGSWPTSFSQNETLMSNILKESLPSNLAAEGYARWDYDLENQTAVSSKAKRLSTVACLPSRMGRTSSEPCGTSDIQTHDAESAKKRP